MRVEDPFKATNPQPLSDGVDPILATAIDSQPKATKPKAAKPLAETPTPKQNDIEVDATPVATVTPKRSLAPWLFGGAVVALGVVGFVLGGRK